MIAQLRVRKSGRLLMRLPLFLKEHGTNEFYIRRIAASGEGEAESMKAVKQKLVQIEEGLRLRKKEFVRYCKPMEQAARRAVELEGFQEFEAQIILADNDFIHRLNRDYRQVDAPTDVISFPANDLDKPLAEALLEGMEPEMSEYGDMIFLGEIYISVDRAQEQAQEYGNTLEEELCFLTVHGMLHLMGYDHVEPADEKIMRAKQRMALGREQREIVEN